MSTGELGTEADSSASVPNERARFADVLADDEEIRFSWDATGVHWANEHRSDIRSPTACAATDRRLVFATDDDAVSVGYDRIRAVKTDPGVEGPELSTLFLGGGGACLVVGAVVAADDFQNGVALVALSVALLVAGSATGDSSKAATVTVVIGNERQRLSFSADEEVGAALAVLANDR
ncbi:hypothetical protein [Halorussus amylolyticus]|uniref:hypothetical protein n=1 Tax=Halorussus amylolyticus TaxID=1126242 RepID=UPI001051E546|nr:hypothetical protein [Halorussus amylolyticus]